MPNVAHASRTFERFVGSVRESDARGIRARAGIDLGFTDVEAVLIAPCGDSYDNLNNYSAVLKLRYDDVVFIIAGDAEVESEMEMIRSGRPLKADVLRVGHHGSRTSTTKAFLDAVEPAYAVIS